jgi:hypothetical protein
VWRTIDSRRHQARVDDDKEGTMMKTTTMGRLLLLEHSHMKITAIMMVSFTYMFVWFSAGVVVST